MQVSSDQQRLAQARALKARGMGLPPDGPPRADILDSWARCMDLGLHSHAALQVPVLEQAELARRRDRAALVRPLAQAELQTLSHQIAGSNFLLAFADCDGVILDLYADNRFSMSGSGAGIVAGSCWSEATAGTNGLGTALAAGKPVAVSGPEHFFTQLGQISCTAAPVHDAMGLLVGVLDASSFFESRQRHTQALVQMAVTHIENGLLAHQMRGHLVLALHPRPEFLSTLSAGLLAFDADGQLLALNGPARGLLSGLNVQRGVGFEALFDEAMGQTLARLQHQAEVRLRDVLGSVLMARMVGRPVGRVLGQAGAAQSASGAQRGGQAGATLPPVPTAATVPTAPTVSAAQAGTAAVQADVPSAASAAAPAAATSTAAPARPGTAAAPAALAAGHRPGSASANANANANVNVNVNVNAAAAAEPLAPAFVADDPEMQRACRLVEAAVRLRVPVLLQGETGTGKELLARHAHRASGRRGEFVALNCAALPAELFEAELFGYVGGAFSGARREGSEGLIRAADGGTLLLDEVRELPLPLQASLLRFLDDGQVRPVGGRQSQQVDVQLLAASHANLEDEVRARSFRQDLLYRLNTVCVQLPPLRLRRDLDQAARWTLQRIDPSARLTDEALQGLAGHGWPGNFRELRAVLTRLLLAQDQQRGPITLAQVQAQLPGLAAPGSVLQRSASVLVREEFERSGRCVSQTSRNLGISRTTVYRHLRT